MALQSFDNSNSDEARQFLLDRRCERLHPKRHRTQKRAKARTEKQKAMSKAKADIKARAQKRFRDQARAYWAGKADGHP